DLTHEIVLRDRRTLGLHAVPIHRAYGDIALSHIHCAHLLVGHRVSHRRGRAIEICLNFVCSDICRGTLTATRFALRVHRQSRSKHTQRERGDFASHRATLSWKQSLCSKTHCPRALPSTMSCWNPRAAKSFPRKPTRVLV